MTSAVLCIIKCISTIMVGFLANTGQGLFAFPRRVRYVGKTVPRTAVRGAIIITIGIDIHQPEVIRSVNYRVRYTPLPTVVLFD